MNWQGAVERTVTGLGYDLVDAEKGAGGLLRVLIDQLPGLLDPAEQKFITVDDCERVTRQLQHVLEVEGCAYERLEVSSPGLDRPLKKAADYVRFSGEQIELTLKMPFKGRKKYSGELQALGDGWRLVLSGQPLPPTRAAKRAAGKLSARAEGQDADGDLALDFSLDEVREARLVPVVDFKGRPADVPAHAPDESAARQRAGSHGEVDGGRFQ